MYVELEPKAATVSPFFFIHVVTIVVVSSLLLITLLFLLNCLMTWYCDCGARKFDESDEADGRKKLLEAADDADAAYYRTIHRLFVEANAVDESCRLQVKVVPTDFLSTESAADTPSTLLSPVEDERTGKTDEEKEKRSPKVPDKTLSKSILLLSSSPSSNSSSSPEKPKTMNDLGESRKNASTTRRIRFGSPQPQNNNSRHHQRDQPKPMASLEDAEAKLAQLRDELAHLNVDHCIQLKTANVHSSEKPSGDAHDNNGSFTFQRRHHPVQQSSQQKRLDYETLNGRQRGDYGSGGQRAFRAAGSPSSPPPLYISYKAKGGGRETIV